MINNSGNEVSIVEVPIELLSIAKANEVEFIRTLGCWPLTSISRFFKDKEAVSNCMKDAKSVSGKRTNFYMGKRYNFYHSFYPGKDDYFNRYIHIDLGLTKDRCGIAMCHVPEAVSITREIIDSDGQTFTDRSPLPLLYYDFVGVIQGSQGNEVQFSYIIELIEELAQRGFNIQFISYDGWQSISSIQQLRDKGFLAGTMSMDRTSSYTIIDIHQKNGYKTESTHGNYLAPYEEFRDAVMDGRVDIPYYNPKVDNRRYVELTLFEEEAFSLEEDLKRNKVDHAPNSTKDLLDAIVGAGFLAAVNECGIAEGRYENKKNGRARNINKDTSVHASKDEKHRSYTNNEQFLTNEQKDDEEIENTYIDNNDVVGF